MARARTKNDDERDEDEDTDNHGSFSNEANSSRGVIETLRLMVLGSNDALMNQACEAILGLPQRENDRNIGACVFKEGQINGRQVSLVKTPSYWLEHLNSYLFFSRGLQSLRNDMEFCESIIFPGPHAFLLVLRDASNSSKDHLLLRALSEIFGKEVLDYSMVLSVRHSNMDILNNRCVKMCRHRYHILENTGNNVPNLLENIENMSNRYRTRYFTKHVHLLENAKKYFQTELNEKYEAMEHSLKGELMRIKMTVKDGRNEIAELKRQNDELRKQSRRGLEDAQVREKQLRRDLEDAQVREKQLRRDLEDSRGREDQLRVDNMKLQSEIKHIKDTEKGLGKTNTDLQVKETELCNRQRDLDDRERNVESEKRELETREREVSSREREVESKLTGERDLAQRNTWSGGSASPRPAETGAESSDGDSQVTRSHVTDEIKPVRRNSLQQPPNMSESGPLHTL